MPAQPVKIIDIGKIVTNIIFGIGIKNENVETKLININRIVEERTPINFNGEDESDLDIYRVHSRLIMNFD
jgi:hypothetical protein